jgi:hypothetical protein
MSKIWSRPDREYEAGCTSDSVSPMSRLTDRASRTGPLDRPYQALHSDVVTKT